MMELWSLLVLVLAVAAGLITATFSGVVLRHRGGAVHRYFLAALLLFNMLILGGLVYRYAEIHLTGKGYPPLGLAVAFWVAMAALKLGWVLAFAGLAVALAGHEPGRPARRRLLGATGLVFVGWALLLVGSAAAGFETTSRVTVAALEIAVIGAAVGACLYLLRQAGRLPASPRRRALLVVGGIHLAVFVLMIASLGIGLSRAAGQTPVHLTVNGIVMVLYNLFPVWWIARALPGDSGSARPVADRFGITPREREIIGLICDGRTNQEIADRLFISLATVKDHNYNIFRKTGVKNRVELVNLFR